MKKIILVLLVMSSILYAKLNTVVSILPQQTFLKAIGGDKINITLMVKPGNSPHTYEPKPSQMKDISKADIYFSVGVEFEEAWLSRFKNLNKNMQIVDMTKGITKIEMAEHSHGDEHKHEKHDDHDDHDEHKDEKHNDHDEHKDEKYDEHKDEKHDDHDEHKDEKHDDHKDEKHDDHDEHENKDPHVWTSPANVKIMAQNIYKTLIKFDNNNKKYYKENLDKFLSKIEITDKNIKNILNHENRKFMVFHPAWGYFAKEYNLTQIAIEVEGKNPKPKELKHLIEEAKEEKVSAIFTSPEFSDTIAKQVANELKIPVIKISPLNKNWSKNLETLAKAIANKKD